ncbi:MAG: hypothetical protein H0V76_10315 [Blastocatellia bacterium]|nr:hypothetical protein [Blastocatellia bacterium]
MARKKRRVEPVAAPQAPSSDPKQPVRYQDTFQRTVGEKIEDFGKLFEGHGRNILYGLGALVVLGIIIWLIMTWSGRSSAEAQTALGRAIRTSEAVVTDQPVPAGSTERTFKTHHERSEAAIAEFQNVADTYGGSVAEKARYFIAVNRLTLDRAAGTQELSALAGPRGEVATLAKFALAQVKQNDGALDEAETLYRELSETSDPVVAKGTIKYELANVLEKQGKREEAVNVLFDLVREASEAKDPEGKPIPLTSIAQQAKDKLQNLDPERAKQLPEVPIESPLGGNPFGF